MAQLTIYLPLKLEAKVRAGARRAKKSLSAYIAERLDERSAEGWPKGYEAMVRGWQADPMELEDPEDEAATFSDVKKAFS